MTPIVLPEPTVSLGAGSSELALQGSGAARIGGVESYFQYGNLLMNDRSLIDTYIIKEIGGFDDADVRDSREPIPQDHGEHVFTSWYGGRTLTLQGTIRAYNIHKLRDMQEALRTEFSSLEDKPLRIISPYKTLPNPDFPGEFIAPDVEIFCRKSQPIQMREAQQNFHFTRDFLITLRSHSPVFTATNPQTLSGLISSPLQFNMNNSGNFYANPTFLLTGPQTNTVITNVTTGQSVTIIGTIPGGETWTLDTDEKTFLDQSGVNKYSTMDVTSEWISIAPGYNSFTQTFTGGSGATAGTMIWKDTWI